MKLIIGAMQEELIDTIKFFNAKKLDDEICDIYQSGELLFCISGIGFLNASSNITYLLTKFDIKEILNIGTCGAYDNKLTQGAIVEIDKAYCLSGDFTAFERIGDLRIPIAYKLKELKTSFVYQKVNIVSAADFIEEQDFIANFLVRINDSISVVDMECFAYAKRANVFKVPFSAIKVVSDVIDGSQNNLQFDDFIKIAGIQILNIVKSLYN